MRTMLAYAFMLGAAAVVYWYIRGRGLLTVREPRHREQVTRALAIGVGHAAVPI